LSDFCRVELSSPPRLVGLLGVHALGLRNQFVLAEKESWDEAAAYVEEQVRPGDAIFFTANVVEAPFNYYFRGLMVPQHGIPVDPNPTRWEEVPVTAGDVGSIREIAGRYRRVWLVYSHEWFDDRERLVPAALGHAGDLEARRTFRDITVFRFRMAEGTEVASKVENEVIQGLQRHGAIFNGALRQ
jgi:hypothetical protein